MSHLGRQHDFKQRKSALLKSSEIRPINLTRYMFSQSFAAIPWRDREFLFLVM